MANPDTIKFNDKRINWLFTMKEEDRTSKGIPVRTSVMTSTPEDLKGFFFIKALNDIRRMPKEAVVLKAEHMILDDNEAALKLNAEEPKLKIPDIPEDSFIYMVRIYYDRKVPNPIVFRKDTKYPFCPLCGMGFEFKSYDKIHDPDTVPTWAKFLHCDWLKIISLWNSKTGLWERDFDFRVDPYGETLILDISESSMGIMNHFQSTKYLPSVENPVFLHSHCSDILKSSIPMSIVETIIRCMKNFSFNPDKQHISNPELQRYWLDSQIDVFDIDNEHQCVFYSPSDNEQNKQRILNFIEAMAAQLKASETIQDISDDVHTP
jgi:hypothetical protein